MSTLYFMFGEDGFYTGQEQHDNPPSLGTTDPIPECPDEATPRWLFPGWTIGYKTPTPPPTPTPPRPHLYISVSKAIPYGANRYCVKLGDEMQVSVKVTPEITNTFFMPLEHEGSATVPIKVEIVKGSGSVSWTPATSGFYRVLPEAINRDLPPQYHFVVEPLTIIVY